MIRRLFALACSMLLLLTLACSAPAEPKDGGADDSGVSTSQPDSSKPADHTPPEDSQPIEDEDQKGTEPPIDGAADEGNDDTGEGRRPIDPEKPMVALTYDDGPHGVYTDQILDILEENRSVATFFEVGRSLYNDADAVRRAEAMGCEIGSHSYRHADLGKLSKEAILSDLDKADANFQDVLGHKPTLLRPPYGSLSRTLHGSTGRSLIAWSIDTEDWLSRDVEKILATVQGVGDLNGQVILMHSTYDTSVEASRILIPWLIEEGYQLVTVTELITQHYGDSLQANGLYNYEYFHFGRPVSLPAAVPETPPVVAPEQPELPPEDPGTLPPEGSEPPPEDSGPDSTDGSELTPGETTPEEPPPEEDPGEGVPPEEGEGQTPPEAPPEDTGEPGEAPAEGTTSVPDETPDGGEDAPA